MTSVDAPVRRVAADVFGLPEAEVTPESSPSTIVTWDSVQHLSLVLALEEEFGVQFDPEDIEQMTTIGAIVDVIEQYKSRA
jgi:acyl carrier protein